MMCPVSSRNGKNITATQQLAVVILLLHLCRFGASGEMVLDVRLLVGLLAVVSGSVQTRGQSSPLSPTPTSAALQSHAGGSAAPRSNGSWPEASQMHNSAARNGTSAGATSESETIAAYSWTTTSAAGPPPPTDAAKVLGSLPGASTSSAPAVTLSSLLTLEPPTPPQLTSDPLATFSSPPVHVEQDAHVPTSTFLSQRGLATTVPPQLTERPPASAAGQGPPPPTHQEVPAQLNVGDEDIKPRHRSGSPLDPLLAGLLSVFIVTTAIVFLTLFFRFRQRTNHPEFHRLQDLPMDDLMEDTPLSRYSY